MKNTLLIIAIILLPVLAKAQINISEAHALLDSLQATLDQTAPNSFMFGIDSPPTQTGAGKNGYSFSMHAKQGSAVDSCICTCYCACKTENMGLTIFRLKLIKSITIEKNKGLLYLQITDIDEPAIVKVSAQKLAKVKGWFGELASYCQKN